MTTHSPPAALAGAVPAAAAVGRPLWSSPTFRNWTRTIGWTLAIVGACLVLNAVEKYQGFLDFESRRPLEHRVFKNPATMAMRIFGLPHFILAILFAASSRRMQSWRNRAIFAGLAVVSVGLCWLFAKAGGNASTFAVFLFYFYFIIHGFRDDAFFYRMYGDMPREAEAVQRRVVGVMQWLAIGLLFSLLWPAYVQLTETGVRPEDPIMSHFFPSSWPFIVRLASMFLPMLVIAGVVVWNTAQRYPGGAAGFWTAHKPILAIYLLTFGIILLAPAVGPWTFDVYILMHFVGWYRFTVFLLDQYRAKEPVRGKWAWMRGTRPGFIVLHTGLVIVVAGLIAVNHYVFHLSGRLDAVVGASSFYYWTIVHVTLSFLPR